MARRQAPEPATPVAPTALLTMPLLLHLHLLLPHLLLPLTLPLLLLPPGSAVCAVAKKLKEHVLAAGSPRRGILPLRCGLRALQPAPEVLTPLHADFFQL